MTNDACDKLRAFPGKTVGQEIDTTSRATLLDWLATVLAISAFFAYILVIGFAPEIFARPIIIGSLISVGLAGGIALTVFLVALAGVYVHLRNKEARQ
jgi:uncharacterized membrane protein (DUF485 family)